MYLSPNISEPPRFSFRCFFLEVINETPVNQPKLVWIDRIWGNLDDFVTVVVRCAMIQLFCLNGKDRSPFNWPNPFSGSRSHPID